MLYREIIAVCSEIHTKHINTLCGQNVELLNVKPEVHIVTMSIRGIMINKTVNTVLRNAVNRLYEGVLYFPNVHMF